MSETDPDGGDENGDDLVRRAKTCRAAFGQLFDRWHPVLYRYCLRRLLARAAAEDATAEVFLKIAAALPRFAGTTEADFRAWAYRLASNVVATVLRQGRRRDELLRQAVREGRFHREEAAFTSADGEALAAALLALPEREQAALTLRYWEGMAAAEVGAVLGLSAGAARVLLHRAVGRLRERLGVTAGASHEC